MSRSLMIALLLGAAIGVPYVVSQTQRGANGSATEAAGEKAAAAEPGGGTASITGIASAGAASTAAASLVSATTMPVTGANISSPHQVLRFDLTKEWVYRTWPRKTTGPTDVGLESVRVPLVTGTRLHDLAGSLTYYFNVYGQVEHISFRGRTGDTAPLVQFLMRTYEFQREAAPPGEQLYQVKRTGRAQSELRTRSEAVLKAESPHSSFAVELELARPGSRRLLPPRGLQLQIPAVAASIPAVNNNAGTSADSTSSDADAGGGSYLEKVRFATPDEEGQVQRMRWPD